MELYDNPRGNYRFAAGSAPYSSGVVAAPGYEIVHATLRRPVPMHQGFERIAQHLDAVGRPRHALCAVELRIPAPLSFAGFIEFNGGYQQILRDWDLMLDGRNPVARTNIAPGVFPPAVPSLYAFSYTVPAPDATMPTFVIAGAGDLRDQAQMSDAAIVRAGESSADALREKAATVMDAMQARLAGVEMTWADVTTANVYTVHPLHSYLVDTVLSPMGAAAGFGVNWQYSHPPIAGLAFEMDVRGIRVELMLDDAAL